MDRRFKLLLRDEIRSSAQDVEQARILFARKSAPLWGEYIRFAEVHETSTFQVEGAERLFRVWGPMDVVSSNSPGNAIPIYLEGIAVADDEGKNLYFLTEGSEGPGLYHTVYDDLDQESAVFIAASFEGLLLRGEGLDRLVDSINE